MVDINVENKKYSNFKKENDYSLALVTSWEQVTTERVSNIPQSINP